MDVVLPDILTAGKTKGEISWFALLEHTRGRVLDGMNSRDLGCIESHGTTIRKRFWSRGILYPRQLVLNQTAEQTDWMVPTYMSGNPARLKPLQCLLQRVDVMALFYIHDCSEGTDAAPAHQELISWQMCCLSSLVTSQQAPAVLADDRWVQVSSMEPIQSWTQALD